jgi:hypothetical protein
MTEKRRLLYGLATNVAMCGLSNMVKISRITLSLISPECVTNAIREAIALAKEHDCYVEFKFRDIWVIATKEDDPQTLYTDYSIRYDILNSKPETYDEKHKTEV